MKGCPFCDHDEVLRPMVSAVNGDHSVVCDACGAQGPDAGTLPEAERLWEIRRREEREYRSGLLVGVMIGAVVSMVVLGLCANRSLALQTDGAEALAAMRVEWAMRTAGTTH